VPLNRPKQKKGKMICIIRLVTHNFMNSSIDMLFNGKNTNILGANGTGKTKLLNAITCIFDSKNYENRKDFEIKVLGEDGNVDDVPVILKKTIAKPGRKSRAPTPRSSASMSVSVTVCCVVYVHQMSQTMTMSYTRSPSMS